VVAAAIAAGVVATVALSGQGPDVSPASGRVVRLNDALLRGEASLHRDGQTGYLRSLLNALDIPAESQLLIFSKTGVQRAYTSPKTPRALYFNPSVVVGYIAGAPSIEVAADDPAEGVQFYTLDQDATRPALVRRTSCQACHVNGTAPVPRLIARSHFVGDDGTVFDEKATHDVNHTTTHPDRWGGWYVTSEGAAPHYAQRAHAGNITFAAGGVTSNMVFVEWMNSAPEQRGYLSKLSDIVGLLLFDHQVHAVNLVSELRAAPRNAALIDQLGDYFVFEREAPFATSLIPLPGFAERVASWAPADRLGRSCAQLDLTDRLMRYPCSYLLYSDAFEALPRGVKEAVYARMLETLSRRPAPERQAVVEILADTKPDFAYFASNRTSR
jgi:hypothetical protein